MKWWMHHILNTRALGEAAHRGDNQAVLAAIGELWKAVKDWEKLTKSPVAGVLMGEHTVLVKLLIDCLAKDKGSGCSDTALDALMGNVESQKALFPKDPEGFAYLFGPHTALAGAYTTDIFNDDTDAFNTHFGQAIENGKQLAAWTDRTFGRES